MTETRIVIAGAGHAGFQLAAALRQAGFAGEIVLLGDEPHLPYNRPPLSKAYLSGGAEETQLAFREDAFFAANDIHYRPGHCVAAIDRAGKAVRLEGGETLAYGQLVLALGARNRRINVPGADLAGVSYLRSLTDARSLRAAMTLARDAVVIGAGFIGLEFAATAAAAGAKVTVVDVAPRILSRALSPEAAGPLQAYHRSLGTDFRFEASVSAIEASGGVLSGVRLSGGERLPADLVLVGIGVVPNVEIAAEAGLSVEDGIVVDGDGRTSDPDISALGDCAIAPNGFGFAPRTRLESVQNANDQARLLAARLAGRPVSGAPPVPWFWSDQGRVKLQMAGLGGPQDERLFLGDPSVPAYSVLRFREGRLACVESVNRPGDHMAARQLLARGLGPTAEQAGTDGFDLKAFAKSL